MRRLLPVAALALLSGACGKDARSPESRAAVSQRLQGEWVLTSFRPYSSFEPMLERLLQVQFGAMSVQIDGRALTVQGIGVAATRSYEINEAQGESFKGVLYDERGVPYGVAGQFQGNRLAFSSLDDPWRGDGELQRRR